MINPKGVPAPKKARRKPRQTERTVLAFAKQLLETLGWFWIRHQQNIGSHAGMSDLSAVKRGITIYIETKSSEWKQTKKDGTWTKTAIAQEKFRADVTRAGALYLRCLTVEEVERDLGAVEEHYWPGQNSKSLFSREG